MERQEIINMFEKIGCEPVCMLKNDPDSIVKGLFNADDVYYDLKVTLKGGIELTLFGGGVVDISNDYVSFKDTMIHGLDNLESIEFGQLGSKAKRD